MADSSPAFRAAAARRLGRHRDVQQGDRRASASTSMTHEDARTRRSRRSRIGAMINATTNDSPMLMPMKAIARVRTSLRVRSATSAVTAADTAPAPCTARARASIATECARARRCSEPAAKSNNPIVISGLRPMRSDQRPNGHLQQRPASGRRRPSPGPATPASSPAATGRTAPAPAAAGTGRACASRRWRRARRRSGAPDASTPAAGRSRGLGWVFASVRERRLY